MYAFAPALDPPILAYPLYSDKISAGFPSPAGDYIEKQLDLNDLLVTHKEATFFLHVQGDSMKNAKIYDGDLLVANRAIVPSHCHIIAAVVNAELTVKMLFNKRGVVKLVAANEAYADIIITPEIELKVWGVVTHVIHRFGKPFRAGRR